MSDIREWLDDLGLGDYAETFEAERINLDALPELDDADLKEMGLPIGPRRLVLKAIRDLKSDRVGSAEAEPTAPAQVDNKARSLKAERRQITVMFCDLVGSTSLSEQLDPEDLRSLMQNYQQAAGGVIERYGGHVAQYLGDGLMIYFGWPQAHEDDAERAARAALETVEAVKGLDTPSPLHVRVGIATGPVVVGATGAGDASVPNIAVGETPNLAARLQGLADTDDIVIGPSTRRLLGEVFELYDLGEHTLKGILEPVQAHKVIGLAATEDRFEARTQHLTPLVGREAEMAMVMARWEQAKAGDGQVILLSGDAGIGKSRITQTLRERVANEPHTRLRYQCSPYHTHSALHPIIEQLERAAGFRRNDNPEQKLDKLERVFPGDGTDRTLAASLLSLPIEGFPKLAMSPQKQKEETLRVLAEHSLSLAGENPLMLIFEDAHWIDPTSQELLDLVVPTIAGHRVLAVITHRTEYEPPWLGQGHVTPLALQRLGRTDASAMVAGVSGATFTDDILDQIVAKTDGIPLFIEELTKMVEEGGAVSANAIPETLQDSLMARLDRLSTVKEIAQIGACIGREFSHELLSMAAQVPEDELQNSLEELIRSELIFCRGQPPNAIYTFKHALVHDAAHSSLLRARRKSCHAAIASALEEIYACDSEQPLDRLARHYFEADNAEKAIHYWLRAGEWAIERSASREAIANLNQALDLLHRLPESRDRKIKELDLLTRLGGALIHVKGIASYDVERSYRRARELSDELGQTKHLFRSDWGICHVFVGRGDCGQAQGMAHELLQFCKHESDREYVLQANHAAWGAFNLAGASEAARTAAEIGWANYDPEHDRAMADIYGGHDPGVCGRNIGAMAVWRLGYPEEALQWHDDALNVAVNLDRPESIAHAYAWAAYLHYFTRDLVNLNDLAQKAFLLAKEQAGANNEIEAELLLGWLRAEQGDPVTGAEMIEDGLARQRAKGVKFHTSFYNCLAAQAYKRAGKFEDAHRFLSTARDWIDRSGERWFEPELHRLHGELLLAESPNELGNAELEFKRALGVAQTQDTKSWELRAATSLARLWRSQDKIGEARKVLAPVYGWFTEGFDTADLKEAKALLDNLQ